MRNRSEVWKSLARHGRFVLDTKARINGRDYTTISAPKINRALMSSPLSVGNCNSASLSFSVLTEDKIPPGSKIVILSRLLSEDFSKASEWAEFGTFFIDKRETRFEGFLALDCYDSMQKLNQPYLDPDDITGTWPRPMKSVVEEVAYRIGVGIDPRTRIRTGQDYIVTYPEDKTMQEVMGYIAACHGGNWIITEENLLRLVPLVTAPDETFRIIDEDFNIITTALGETLIYTNQEHLNAVLPAPLGELPGSVVHRTFFITDDDGKKIVTPEGYYLIWDTEEEAIKLYDDESLLNIPVVCGSLDTGDFLTVSGVRISNDDGDFSAGDDSGFVLDIGSNPYATQTICDDLYTAYHGLVYQPFTAAKALFDPALELGDQLVIRDKVTSVLMSESLTFEHNFRADLEAPNDEELNREYPYLTIYDKLDKVQTQAKKNGEALEKITVRVERTEDSLESEISRAEREESRISQKLDSITLSVSNGSTSSTIQLKAGDTVISSKRISFSGVVSFSDLSTAGETTICGDNITTGNINILEGGGVTLQGTAPNGEGGGVSAALGNDGKRTTYGAKVYGVGGEYYCIATNAGVCMRGPSASLYVSGGSIHASTAISEGSDRNLKNSIDHDLNRYKALFMALQPAAYKFNDGTSGRLHTGFIAQEVEDAIIGAGLTTKDFAGLVIDTHENPKRHCEQVTEYGLRYSEFISLNTYMIQQAFMEIESMKKEIAALKAEIQALKEGK